MLSIPANLRRAMGLTADAAGNLYTVGQAGQTVRGGTYQYATIRKSADGGNSWSTVDSYLLPGSYNSINRAVSVDSAGNVFACGDGNASGGTWFIRELSAGANAFVTVDTYQLSAGATGVPCDIIPFGGRMFAAGYSADSAGIQHWIIRATP